MDNISLPMHPTPDTHDNPNKLGASGASPLPADLVSEAIEHMNADHGAAVLAYAQGLAGLAWADRARLLDIDTAGIVVQAEDDGNARVETARIAFPQPLAQPAELRMALVDLARAARAARDARTDAEDPSARAAAAPAAAAGQSD
jgi:hypothetical protein